MSERDDRAESIRHRLRNALRARGEDVGLGLQQYVMERFLYRLGRSKHRERFVLKGAALFAIWGTTYRPTRDLDFTGYGAPDPKSVIGAIREVCQEPDDVDTLTFDTDGITAEPIRDGSEYHGLRLKVRALLGESHIPLQVDIGFGNAIVPGPEEVDYRTILGDPSPRILAYPREAVVAEKLHAMAVLGEQNSRYKDFYDLNAMATAFGFDRDTLVRAVRATFERRATPITGQLPAALTGPFYSNEVRAGQWRAYVTRNKLAGVSPDFVLVGERIIRFVRPVWEDIVSGSSTPSDWPPEGPWRQE